ncbi:MAG: hypothetical protein ACHQ50_15150 [Fimbriimonadales bacterium]
MKLRTALTLAALATIMSLPFAANAQGPGDRGSQRGPRQGQDTRGGTADRGNSGRTQDTQTTNRGGHGQQSQPPRDGTPYRGTNSGHPQDNRNSDSGGNGQQNQGNRGSSPGHNQYQGRSGQKSNDRGSTQRNRGNRDSGWNDRGSGSNTVDRGGNGDQWDHHFYRPDHDDWRDILFTGGLFADIDFLLNDGTVCFDGSYGAYYPIWRFDQDRDSRDATCRARAELFDHTFFYRNGARFERRTVMHNGVECYRFVRG